MAADTLCGRRAAGSEGEAMKIGLVRCMQTEELCPASRCLEYMRTKKDAFAGVEGEIVLVGVTT
ncbi:CGGC domain-containing protein, partial [uncultured Desulfovibrio sp.]|uniref:CGGC domain-containing protein n=1 Tax=uncultured Desulfovibrio sp. TaxID=167968 RepID=UPI00345F31A5